MTRAFGLLLAGAAAVAACSSDAFKSTDGGTDAASPVDAGAADDAAPTDASSDAGGGCGHTFCESFDTPPTTPTWSMTAWQLPEINPPAGPFIDVQTIVVRSAPGALRAQVTTTTADVTRALLKRSLLTVPTTSIRVDADVRWVWTGNAVPSAYMKLAFGGEAAPREVLSVFTDGNLQDTMSNSEGGASSTPLALTGAMPQGGTWFHVTLTVAAPAVSGGPLFATVDIDGANVGRFDLQGHQFSEPFVYLGITRVSGTSSGTLTTYVDNVTVDID